MCRAQVLFADLTEQLPWALRRPFDWTMSIEVAEHVPRQHEAVFVHSLVAHTQAWSPIPLPLPQATPPRASLHLRGPYPTPS